MLAKVGEERALCTERRRLSEDVEAEVAPLEFALTKVTPLRKGNRRALMRAHRQGVTMDEILRENIESGPIEVV